MCRGGNCDLFASILLGTSESGQCTARVELYYGLKFYYPVPAQPRWGLRCGFCRERESCAESAALRRARARPWTQDGDSVQSRSASPSAANLLENFEMRMAPAPHTTIRHLGDMVS